MEAYKKAYEKLLEIGQIKEFDIRFLEYDDTLCDSKLHQLAERISMLYNKKIICIFNRDIPKTVKDLKNDYKYYKNNKKTREKKKEKKKFIIFYRIIKKNLIVHTIIENE